MGVLYPFVMAALLGIGDGVLNTQLNALLGMLFKQDTVCNAMSMKCDIQDFDKVMMCVGTGSRKERLRS